MSEPLRITRVRAAVVETLRARFPGAVVFVLVAERVDDRHHQARAVAELSGLDGNPWEASGPWRPSELRALEDLARGLGAELPRELTTQQRQQLHRARARGAKA